MDGVIWFGRYEGWLRLLAKGVKDGDPDCIDKAARLFDLMLPDDCVVVPMPSHKGTATVMEKVAQKVARMNCGTKRRKVWDGLVSSPHESSMAQKRDGLFPAFVNMVLEPPSAVGDDWDAQRYYVIDNVVCTGVTANAALEAFRCHELRDVTVCTLARSPWR
jgi:hypothetical protein